MEDGDVIKCHCGIAAALKTSSRGRKYYGCSKIAYNEQQCEFTRMIPLEAIAQVNNSLATVSVLERDHDLRPPSATTSTQPMKRIISNVYEGETTFTPSQKRTKTTSVLIGSPPKSQPEEPLTPSQKRTKEIEAALTGSLRTNSEIGAKQLSITSLNTPESWAKAGPSMMEDASNEVQVNRQLFPEVDSSQRTVNESCLAEAAGIPLPSRVVDADGARIPRTLARQTGEEIFTPTGLSSPSPSPFQISKGKQKAHDENGGLASIRVTPVAAGSGGATPAPTKIPQRFSSASIANALKELTDLPEHVRRLERSLGIKDLKIKHLENEVQRLKTKQDELETVLKYYESTVSDETISSQ